MAHLEMIRGIKTQFDNSQHSNLYPVFVRVECETPTPEFLENKNLYEN